MIPKAVEVSTIVGMGLQIALLGMMSVNLVVKNNYSTLKKLCTGEEGLTSRMISILFVYCNCNGSFKPVCYFALRDLGDEITRV